MSRPTRSLCWLGALLVLVGCDSPPGPAPDLPTKAPAEEPIEPAPDGPTLPRSPGRFSPAFTSVAGDVSLLSDVVTCRSCHEDVAEHWSRSAHARSSFDNPWYRASVEAFREARGNEASRFCAGCHDPVLLVEGAMDDEVDPNDFRAHLGITCLVCHSAEQTSSDGNGSYTLNLAAVPIPDPDDPAQVELHVARVTPDPLRTAALCGACHRSFIGRDAGSAHHIGGIDDIGAWRSSAYAGSDAARPDQVEQDDCRGCHMQDAPASQDLAAVEGMVASHAVRASHTALPGYAIEEHVDDDETSAEPRTEGSLAERDRAALAGAASIDVAAAEVDGRWRYPADSAPQGRRFKFDVVVRNEHAGHRFPGGTRDLQDTWIEVVVEADGERIAEAGLEHIDSPDPSAYRFRSVLLDEDGRPEEDHLVHRFVAPAFDRTIAARDAAVIRYEFDAGRSIRPRVRVRLLHRKHSAGLRAQACAASRTREGRAFAAASVVMGRVPIDACADEPITVISETTVTLGDETELEPADTYARLRNLVLARAHALQERLEEAREAADAAARFAESPDELRVLVAGIAGRQGRVEETLELLAGDLSLPAARTRGRALAQVWRWEEAAREFRSVADRNPGDPVAWVDLTLALGSAGQDDAAAEAARRGLAFAPRSEALLRTQALAWNDDAAREAYLAHRSVDEAPSLLRRCEDLDEVCARDRQPIPLIALHRIR